MLKNIILLIFIIVLNGCGMMGSSSKKDTTIASSGIDTNTTETMDTIDDNSSGNLIAESGGIEDAEEENSILPQTISMEFPNILKPNDTNGSSEDNQTIDSNISIENNQTTEDNQTEKINDIGYEQLKKSISQIEDIVKIAQINLVLLEKVMPQVLDRCQGMLSCTFEPQALSIILDNRTIAKIDEIIDDNNVTLDEYNNSRVSLGELVFTKKYVDEGNDYELKLDMASNDTILRSFYKESNESDNNITTVKNRNDINSSIEEFQTFKWNDYNKNVTTRYFYRDINRTIDVSIYYLTDENGKETMHVYNRLAEEGHKENISLTLTDKEEDNSTIQIQTNSIEEISEGNDTNISSFSSTGEITEDSSLILFSGSTTNPNLEDNITSNRELICNNSDCNESNSSQIDNNIQFYQLKITDINLTDGSYVLLPPYINIEEFSLIDIFKVTIGTFTIFEGKAQGEIHNSNYNDVLDELTIVKIKEPDEVNSSKDLFEIVPEEKRPTIEILD